MLHGTRPVVTFAWGQTKSDALAFLRRVSEHAGNPVGSLAREIPSRVQETIVAFRGKVASAEEAPLYAEV